MPWERSEDARPTACRTVKASYRQQVLALNAYPPRLNPTALPRKKPLSQLILSTSPIRRASIPRRSLARNRYFSQSFPQALPAAPQSHGAPSQETVISINPFHKPYPPRLNPTALPRKKPLSQSILSTSPIRRASSPWRLTKGTVFSLVFPFSPVNRPVNFSFPAVLTAHLFSNRLWPYFMLVLITFICPDRRSQQVCGKTPPDAMRPAVGYSVMQFSFRLLWARCFVPVPFDAAHPRYVFG